MEAKEVAQVESGNHFIELNNINVNKHVEVKKVKNKQTGQITHLSYLSWPFAIAEIKKRDVTANWEFLEPIVYPDKTMMVHCNFTCFGITHYMWLPVMDFKNQALPNPNAFEINKTMMRCLVKAIAVHGLGLYIYAGEDLPEEEKDEQISQQQAQQAAHQQARQQAANSNQQQKPGHASQLALEKQEAALQRALAKINATTDPEDLNASLAFFSGTNHEQVVRNACDAKADREGWRA